MLWEAKRVEGDGENSEEAMNIEFESIMWSGDFGSWIRKRRTLNANPLDDLPTSRAEDTGADKAPHYTSSFITLTATKILDDLIII